MRTIGKKRDCKNRLQGTVTALLDEGIDSAVIIEILAAIGRNLARHGAPGVKTPLDSRLAAVPVPQSGTILFEIIAGASALSLNELGKLDKWLCARIADEKAQAGQIHPSPGRIVVEERKGKDITYRLEFVKCGKDSCRKCRRGPAHGPYWYAYGQRAGRRARNKYIGKTLDPQALADTTIVTTA